jgi:hypothetical protein
LGAALVVACVLAFAATAAGLGDRVAVLAAARPVPAGQPITAADLKQVYAVDDAELGLIPAAQAGQVVGRTPAVPLVAGVLLTPALLGDAAFPPPGKMTASLALKPGQYPQGVTAGARVAVFVHSAASTSGGQSAGATGSASPPVRLEAVVLGVDLAGDGQGATVITLLLDAADGSRLAAAPAGGVVLMQTTPGGE